MAVRFSMRAYIVCSLFIGHKFQEIFRHKIQNLALVSCCCLLGIVFTNSASAAFLKLANLPSPWQELAVQKKSAMFRFASVEEATAQCTGTIISSQGHAIVPRHCFEACLRRHGVYKTQAVEASSSLFFIAISRPKSITCMFFHKPSDDLESDVEIGDAEILAQPPGRPLLNPTDERINDITDFVQGVGIRRYEDLKQNGIDLLVSDWLVVRSEHLQNRTCISQLDSAADATHSLSESLALGFPRHSLSRTDGDLPSGRDLYATLGSPNPRGVLDSNAEHIEKLKNQMPELNLRAAYEHTDMYAWTSHDVAQGMSGAALLNQSGQFAGMMTYNLCSTRQSMQGRCRNSAGVLTAQGIKTQFLLKHSPELWHEYTRCMSSDLFRERSQWQK